MNKVDVSVVISIYNGEEYVRTCLDSMVKQSLENLELVVIDHGSEDHTWEIIQEYANKYDKISPFSIKHEGTLGRGRNFGVEHAKGEYIGFCDADDYMDERAYELMYAEAKTGDYDIVCAPMYEVTNGNMKLTRVTPNPTVESMLTGGSMSLCNKIIRKSLFEKCGEMRDDIYYEDVSITPRLISYANKIGYIDYPVYYYVMRDGSIIHSDKFIKCLDYIKASKYAIELCNPQYVNRLVSLIMRGSMGYIKRQWHLSEAFIQYIHDLYNEYPDAVQYVTNKNWNQQFISWGKDCSFIPRNIYLNGFLNKYDDEYIKYLEENAFYNGCKITVINGKNCDLVSDTVARELWERKKYLMLGLYLGIKAISQNGGFYIGERMEIITFLNAVTQFDFILGHNKESMLRGIVGGKKDCCIWNILLACFEEKGAELEENELINYIDSECEIDLYTSNTMIKNHKTLISGTNLDELLEQSNMVFRWK